MALVFDSQPTPGLLRLAIYHRNGIGLGLNTLHCTEAAVMTIRELGGRLCAFFRA